MSLTTYTAENESGAFMATKCSQVKVTSPYGESEEDGEIPM